ncbi:MAG: hypothetical protein EBU97_02660, partial [Rhodobacteraceae bacterium]|nr:hypothetical protein [Paracoccaceae bacterium]
ALLWGVGAGLCLPDTWLGHQTAAVRDTLVAVFSPEDGAVSLARFRALFESGPYIEGPKVNLHPFDK